MEGITVIICCYNSESIIRQTLGYLARQKTSPGLLWEIILVDNASTDNTTPVARNASRELGIEALTRIVHESQKGLTFARKAGVNAAQYSFILFCDDDNFLVESYVQLSYQVMVDHPEVGAIGGQGIFHPETEPEKWFKGFERSNMAIGPQGTQTGDITRKKGCIYGAGMVIRKICLQKIAELGYAQFCSDRSGSKMLSAGDTELSYIIRLLGYRLYYHEQMTFLHLVSKRKLTQKYMLKLYSGFCYTYPIILAYTDYLQNKRSGTVGLMWTHFKMLIPETARLIYSMIRPFRYRAGVIRSWLSYAYLLWHPSLYAQVQFSIAQTFKDGACIGIEKESLYSPQNP